MKSSAPFFVPSLIALVIALFTTSCHYEPYGTKVVDNELQGVTFTLLSKDGKTPELFVLRYNGERYTVYRVDTEAMQAMIDQKNTSPEAEPPAE